VYGINAAGDIVGTYTDNNSHDHGFLLSGGSYTTINYPGAKDTALFGINDMGQIVGSTGVRPVVSFLYDLASQTFTTIKYPQSSETFVAGINNAGTAVGYYVIFGPGYTSGFEVAGSTYKPIIPPRAPDFVAVGISSSGIVAGAVTTRQGTLVNVLFKQGKYYPVTIPVSQRAGVYGTNPAGTALVGFYQSFPPAGLVYHGKTLQTLQFPGAMSTLAYGVNDAGEVVGNFEDAGYMYHGFTWTPPADPTKK
jgi:probable HAF family extracellular repeat protein